VFDTIHCYLFNAFCDCALDFIDISPPVGCRGDNECPLIQSCINNECVDTCLVTQCGINALCTADGYHKTRCYCPDGYIGNPYEICERPECTSDSDCFSALACRNLKCVDPCNCPPPALCTVVNHRPICKCPPGYIGNPYTSCLMGKNMVFLLVFQYSCKKFVQSIENDSQDCIK